MLGTSQFTPPLLMDLVDSSSSSGKSTPHDSFADDEYTCDLAVCDYRTGPLELAMIFTSLSHLSAHHLLTCSSCSTSSDMVL
jgi:hypothetical protein